MVVSSWAVWEGAPALPSATFCVAATVAVAEAEEETDEEVIGAIVEDEKAVESVLGVDEIASELVGNIVETTSVVTVVGLPLSSVVRKVVWRGSPFASVAVTSEVVTLLLSLRLCRILGISSRRRML